MTRGDDDDASDIDMAVITTHADAPVVDRVRRLRGMIIDVGAITADAYLAESRRIGDYRRAGRLRTPRGWQRP